MKVTTVNKDAVITDGVLKGTKGRVVAFDSIEDEVTIRLDEITCVQISSDFINQD
ncbi:hypothetical protein [Heyndrickxia sporothermodurans]|jgi:hypothetical protein|uniref:hypothetical protein n=1 Tax=Heyndrickxia sporothermodurans TaxID=46224 RepID=UPI0013FD8533|nr:hypothetical protein [Heyndrickxia sporothermodurans]